MQNLMLIKDYIRMLVCDKKEKLWLQIENLDIDINYHTTIYIILRFSIFDLFLY